MRSWWSIHVTQPCRQLFDLGRDVRVALAVVLAQTLV
jgi:hypothetical protein